MRQGDSKGRHTTTQRELLVFPFGVLVDTPGMRELQLWATQDALEETFPDVAAVAEGCRFSDCAHQTEPGCAVRAAVASGELPAERFDSWRKLQQEQSYQHRRQEGGVAPAEERRLLHREQQRRRPKGKR